MFLIDCVFLVVIFMLRYIILEIVTEPWMENVYLVKNIVLCAHPMNVLLGL